MEYSINRAQYLGHFIERYYQSFGANIRIDKVKMIPDLRRYIFKVEFLLGAKVHAIFACAEDIKTALKLHLFYPFRKGTGIFIAVSEFDVNENDLLRILRSYEFANSNMHIPLAIGYDLVGAMFIVDLAKLVHLLIVGPSGTGKSVALQCIVLSIIVKCPIHSVRLLLFDIGANSLTLFEEVKHLYHPIVKDVETGIVVLEALVDEMNERLLHSEGECQSFPFIVCIIDEFDDTIADITDREKARRFISSINSIIRRGRKAKVILVLASHDPTLKNAKVNINGIVSRIAFKCAKHQNSSTALGVTGAENLSGKGAMLFKSQEENTIVALQGSLVTPDEINKILKNAPVGYEDIDLLKVKEVRTVENMTFDNTDSEKVRKELADIVFGALGRVTISVLQIQKNFKMGNRATEIMDALCKMNIVTNKFSNQPRMVIPTCIENLSMNVVNLLEQYGYTKAQIIELFESKSAERE